MQHCRPMNTGELRDCSEITATVHDRYAIEVRPTPRWAVPLLAVAALAVATVTQAIGRTYGGRRVIVTDRDTGGVVGRFREGWLVDEHSPIGIMLTEARTMSADEFEARWLRSVDNRLLGSSPTP
jgi:hypothetical protein